MRAQATLYVAATEARKHSDGLNLGQHYAVTLLPEGSVKFASPPARTRKSAQPMAGLLYFKTVKAGLYRISLTSRHWIDVLDGAENIQSRAHEGRSGCKLLHKVVEFDLPGGRELTLQLSGDDSSTVGLVITPVET